MKKAANVLWAIFIGLPSCVYLILSGISACITIIGIPYGIYCFKALKLQFAPLNKQVYLSKKI